jgi:transcriptional regulator with XRE-family HTH domain
MSVEPTKPKKRRGDRVTARRSTLVDIHVGRNVRTRRIELGLSQTELADACGITFQQVQKYENGVNRVSAGRLWQFSAVLGIPLEAFFEGLGKPSTRLKMPISDPQDRVVDDESAKIARRIAALRDPKLRRHIKNMLSSFVAGQDKK